MACESHKPSSQLLESYARISSLQRVGRDSRLRTVKELLASATGEKHSRSSRTSESLHTVYKPAFCFIAQGRKRALLGEEVFRYEPGHYLLFTVDLRLIFQVEKATPAEPYLGLRLDLDPSLVASVDDFARELGMSVSGFHHHFKSVTSMSPLQFQKHLRLQEARRLMLGEGCRERRVPCGLRGPFTFQPAVQKAFRSTTTR